jgi:hypothetical protein
MGEKFEAFLFFTLFATFKLNYICNFLESMHVQGYVSNYIIEIIQKNSLHVYIHWSEPISRV